MLVSDYILKFLTEKKVKDVFLLTGGAITFVVDAFSRNKNILPSSFLEIYYLNKNNC